jgi:biotin synthase
MGRTLDLLSRDPDAWTVDEIAFLLSLDKASQGDPTGDQDLFAASAAACDAEVGSAVFVRSIIEFSNICAKNCFYCGLRRDAQQTRYTMDPDTILEGVHETLARGIRSVVLQSGEVPTAARLDWLCALLERIKAETSIDPTSGEPCEPINVVISVGEYSEADYARLRVAGAHRVLLRIETSDPDIYARLHPNDEMHSWHTRVECVRRLDRTGYMTGSGLLIAFPGQTVRQAAADLKFLVGLPVDMVGMGPYVPQPGTPLAQEYDRLYPTAEARRQQRVAAAALTVRMTAVLRLLRPSINIAATTALQAISPGARRLALQVGANVVMPVMTPQAFREQYALYEGKAAIGDASQEAYEALGRLVASAGKHIVYGTPGNPQAWLNKWLRRLGGM